MSIRSRTTIAAAAAAAPLGAAAHAGTAGDGGSGTYTSSGTGYSMVLFNSGTTRWMFFHVVGPPGTVFVAGETAAELTLKLQRPYRGRSVRIVATASVGGVTVTSTSKAIAVR